MAGEPALPVSEEDARYRSPLAHALRARFLSRWGGEELPVPVERIARDELGLRIEESWELDGECSGMLIPSERLILVNARETAATAGEAPIRRARFTVAHEVGHWECHVRAAGMTEETFCRPVDLSEAADRTLEREANVFAAELLMPEDAVRAAWDEAPDAEACARRFDVSPLAMRWRLYGFGLVQERPA
jgi:hypothetical protein